MRTTARTAAFIPGKKKQNHTVIVIQHFLYTKNIHCLENKGNINSFLKKDNDQHVLKLKFA